jgi:SSS family solute:Na+ symporter
LCIGIASVLAHSKGGALSMWFSISGIASGGLAGLFLLAFFSNRTNRQGVYTGIAACTIFTAWATLTMGNNRLLNLGRYNYPWNDLIIGAIAHIVLFTVGYAASYFFPAQATAEHEMTLWRWLKVRQTIEPAAVTSKGD